MSILLIAQDRDLNPFKEALLQKDKNLDVEIWPGVKKAEHVQFAVAWNQPKHVFDSFPNLKVISSLGAGADHLISDDTIPEHIIFTKADDPSLASQMIDYIHAAILSIVLKLPRYHHTETWDPQPKFTKEDLNIGVMGLGNIGEKTALYLSNHGFHVYGLSTSKKSMPGVRTFTGKKIDDFLREVNILVNLLPLTDKTEGILNLELFQKLRKPSFLINTARGRHLVDEDLLYAIDTDAVEYAFLDVFTEEPLPDSHPFRSRENIFITPHIAGRTDPGNLAAQIIENYKRLLSGMVLQNIVDKKKGY